jgi:16S rRNA (uracil1498-N3)-methyltransferase
MRISRVYVGEALSVGAEIRLDKAASHYLKHVLRLNTGAAVVLFNGIDDKDYYSSVDVEGKLARVSIEKSTDSHTESSLHSEIIQGLSRSDHSDWMIQKTTELGVNRITLFNAERTQSHLKPAQLEKKLAHWQAVAISACEQCGRAIVPQITFYTNLDRAMETCQNNSRVLLDFDGPEFSSLVQSKSINGISILLGPEGGLSKTEINTARKFGFEAASLGPRVLRTETAAVVALAIVQAGIGDLR